MKSHPSRILLIQIRRFGDVVLTTPLAEDLRKKFPDARVDFMVGRAAAPMLLNNPNINDILFFEPDNLTRMIANVRSRRYDWIVDSQVHPRTAITSWASGVSVRAGWDARFWGRAYTHRTPRDTEPMYVVQNRRRLLQLLGVETGVSLPQIYLSDNEKRQGAEDAAANGIGAGRKTIAIVIGTHDPYRDWNPEGFGQLATSLEQEGHHVAIFRFPGDDAHIAQFREGSAAGVLVPWRGDRRFLALLKHCNVLVSPNTGPSHMATALGVPRVTLYGSTDPVTWSPPIPSAAVVTNPRSPCLRCSRGACPVNYECMRGIKAEDVLPAIRQMLSLAPDNKADTMASHRRES